MRSSFWVALSFVVPIAAFTDYALVGPSADGSPLDIVRYEPYARHLAARQAATFTGCACPGWQYVQKSPPGPNVQILAGQGQAITGFTQVNTRGWCWQDGAILPDENTETLNALTTATNTYRVNGLYIRKYCDSQQTGLNNTACIARMFTDYYNALAAANAFSNCTWPTSNFAPVDCNCAFTCTSGYVACGRQCINPATQLCVSSLPQPKKRSLSMKCPLGYDRCALPTGGFDCIDVNSDLESCGGCPSYDDDDDSENARGVDCSVLPGVASVACVQGECRVESCLRKHRLVHNACLPL